MNHNDTDNLDFRDISIQKISETQMISILVKYHYMKYLPRLSKEYIGGFIDGELVGAMSLGWGVRPKHTIQKLFPSMDTDDYRSIGRLVLKDELPRNSESYFISKCISFIEKKWKDLKLLFSWADGLLGKPGYIYQASNFFYGGYIWTDTYFTNKGERVHPRQTNRIGGRPSYEELKELNWEHYRGKQFRYVYFLCNKGEQKRLLRESDFDWTRKDYPKENDLNWKKRTDEGWEYTSKPNFNPEVFEYNSDKARKYEEWKDRRLITLSNF